MDEETQVQTEEKDILDFNNCQVLHFKNQLRPNKESVWCCPLCSQKFTNKLKVTLHWAVNHGYKLCGLCTNYAFRYESDKIQHERGEHLPFGCSSCSHEFNTTNNEIISEHYKSAHQSFLCFFCSSVIEPYSKFPEHIEKKHNVMDYSKFASNNSALYELTKDGFFHCKMCDKTKRINLLFGHYVFHHNLSITSINSSIHALKDKASNIQINGSLLNEVDTDAERNEVGIGEICCVCEKPISADSNIHEVFCQGYVMCNQKECEQLFANKKALSQHLDLEHPKESCKFGCRETKLHAGEIVDHLQQSHDIVDCNLCVEKFINSSFNYKNHLKDKHSVNLMTYEKALSQTTMKLYRVEASTRHKKHVLCNFCDRDITKEIREFSFINHYQNQHEINIIAILKNLDKNPIIDVILNDKKIKIDDECLKNFTIVVENSMDELIEMDFDTSKVYCIGTDQHLEQKPRLMEDDISIISCEFCKKTTFDATCRLYEHLTDSHGFRLLNVDDRCDTCNFNIQKPVTMADEDDKSFNLSLVCPVAGCESFHVTKDNFKSHMAFEHSEQLNQEVSTDKIIYKCFECNFAYNKLDDMRQHFRTTHPDVKMSYCSICRVKLTNPSEYFIHFNLNHADYIKQIEKFRCKLCKKLFTKKTKAKLHYDNYHKKREINKKSAFKCQFKVCKEAFENKEDRKMHQMMTHPDEKMFACKSCPLRFSTKSSLSSHNLIHKNIINTCEFCQKTFIRRDSFKEHLLIHSGVRQKCSFCEKTFVQRSNLVRHERIHLNDKPYKCSFCEKTFSDKGACNSHEKVHTKSEHSNCEVCGKHFARKQKLKYHMRIHTLENVLTCECGKIFTESYSFRKHKETHLKKRADKCDECGKILKSSKAKGEHMILEHGVSFPEVESLIETRIKCTLCTSKDFTMETIKEHLSTVHSIDETNDWENYIGEVEFEMEEDAVAI